MEGSEQQNGEKIESVIDDGEKRGSVIGKRKRNVAKNVNIINDDEKNGVDYYGDSKKSVSIDDQDQKAPGTDKLQRANISSISDSLKGSVGVREAQVPALAYKSETASVSNDARMGKEVVPEDCRSDRVSTNKLLDLDAARVPGALKSERASISDSHNDSVATGKVQVRGTLKPLDLDAARVPEALKSERTSFSDSNKGSTGVGKAEVPDAHMSHKSLDLDAVLETELGQFGRYQARCLMLVAIPLIMNAVINEYIFSAAAVPHRCQIPECGENSKSVPFAPVWVLGAIPPGTSCERYTPIGGNGTPSVCPATLFDQATTVPCQGYVYERENSVVYEFDLGCREWLRALAGTLNSVGTLLVLPVTGWVSDRWGRRVALLASVGNMAAMGVLRAFSPSYPVYLALQLLQTTLGAGVFSSAYIFVAELVGPRYRVVVSATASSLYAAGGVVLGGVAWLVWPWRLMILALHVPCFLIISYYWVLDESVRWLLSKGRYAEARVALLKVARVNGNAISDKSLAALTEPTLTSHSTDYPTKPIGLVRRIWSSAVLRRRVMTTPVWWVTATLVYYGLNINSTGLAGNMYANYMAICAVEIPGFYTAVLLLDRIGRRWTLAGGYLLSALCNIAFAFLPEDAESVRLSLFLMGKFGISAVFTSLYLFTSELYPTAHRHRLLAFSSMVGRVGSILAPLTPALRQYWSGLPSVVFGALGLVSGGLVLTQPETLGRPLPDTLEEAEGIGAPSTHPT